MMAILEKVMLFIQPMSLAVLLVYVYGFFSRSSRSTVSVNAIMGCVFGLAAVSAMASPMQIAEGVIVDIRSLFIGVAAAYFGVVGGAIALLMGVMMRIHLGGSGMIFGVMAMSVAALMGLVWRYWVRPRINNSINATLMLGGMISAHMGVALLMPPQVRDTFFAALGPTLLTANFAGSVILGKLIERERMLVDETVRLMSAASTDSLTQLMNRDSAVRTYAALPALSHGEHGVAMLCIDVDAFKLINDTYGHMRGDRVLIDIAQRMSACLRPDDIFARMSGDEFLIVLHDLDRDHAKAVAERCRKTIDQVPVIAEGAEIDVSVSIGGAWSSHRPGFATFRGIADKALYHAKARGRDCVVFDAVADDIDELTDADAAA